MNVAAVKRGLIDRLIGRIYDDGSIAPDFVKRDWHTYAMMLCR